MFGSFCHVKQLLLQNLHLDGIISTVSARFIISQGEPPKGMETMTEIKRFGRRHQRKSGTEHFALGFGMSPRDLPVFPGLCTTSSAYTQQPNYEKVGRIVYNRELICEQSALVVKVKVVTFMLHP